MQVVGHIPVVVCHVVVVVDPHLHACLKVSFNTDWESSSGFLTRI